MEKQKEKEQPKPKFTKQEVANLQTKAVNKEGKTVCK